MVGGRIGGVPARARSGFALGAPMAPLPPCQSGRIARPSPAASRRPPAATHPAAATITTASAHASSLAIAAPRMGARILALG